MDEYAVEGDMKNMLEIGFGARGEDGKVVEIEGVGDKPEAEDGFGVENAIEKEEQENPSKNGNPKNQMRKKVMIACWGEKMVDEGLAIREEGNSDIYVGVLWVNLRSDLFLGPNLRKGPSAGSPEIS